MAYAGVFLAVLVASWIVLVLAPADVLPEAPSLAGQVIGEVVVAVLVGVLWWMTRDRTPIGPERGPRFERPGIEALGLLGYLALVVGLGARLGLHGHVAGVGLDEASRAVWSTQAPGDLLAWTAYFGLAGGIVPYAVFRFGLGYDREALLLGFPEPRKWVPYCGVTGVLGVAGFAGSAFLEVSLLGHAATFLVFALGAWLPVAILLQSLLAPRLAMVSGSWIGGAVLAGLAYAAYHGTEHYLAWGTGWEAAVSGAHLVQLAVFGVLKAVTTLRTGSAWIHVFNTHTPHLSEAPAVARVLGL